MARYVVSAWTASKIAFWSFLLGLLLGLRLHKTIRRIAAKVLEKIKDDD
jgi:ABC-type uncharacterized transport system permease subunit